MLRQSRQSKRFSSSNCGFPRSRDCGMYDINIQMQMPQDISAIRTADETFYKHSGVCGLYTMIPICMSRNTMIINPDLMAMVMSYVGDETIIDITHTQIKSGQVPKTYIGYKPSANQARLLDHYSCSNTSTVGLRQMNVFNSMHFALPRPRSSLPGSDLSGSVIMSNTNIPKHMIVMIMQYVCDDCQLISYTSEKDTEAISMSYLEYTFEPSEDQRTIIPLSDSDDD